MDRTGLSELLTKVLSGRGLELDGLEITPVGRRRIVRVTVDGDGSHGRGPDLDQISEATRAVSQALDAEDAMGEAPYTLEVSSRGVSRPLTRPAHYRRNTGRLVTVKTATDAEPITGRITAADESTVTLDVAGAAVSHRLDQITSAIVQVEMNRRLDDDDSAPDQPQLDQSEEE